MRFGALVPGALREVRRLAFGSSGERFSRLCSSLFCGPSGSWFGMFFRVARFDGGECSCPFLVDGCERELVVGWRMRRKLLASGGSGSRRHDVRDALGLLVMPASRFGLRVDFGEWRPGGSSPGVLVVSRRTRAVAGFAAFGWWVCARRVRRGRAGAGV